MLKLESFADMKFLKLAKCKDIANSNLFSYLTIYMRLSLIVLQILYCHSH